VLEVGIICTRTLRLAIRCAAFGIVRPACEVEGHGAASATGWEATVKTKDVRRRPKTFHTRPANARSVSPKREGGPRGEEALVQGEPEAKYNSGLLGTLLSRLLNVLLHRAASCALWCMWGLTHGAPPSHRFCALNLEIAAREFENVS
jgi:hypothetical protein